MTTTAQGLPEHWVPIELLGCNAAFGRAARAYAEEYASLAVQRALAAQQQAAPAPAAPAVAIVTECEACFTPDVCQLRGTCDHYAAERLRVQAPAAEAVQPAPAPATREGFFALREGLCIGSLDAYFTPRPVEDGAMQRRAFEAGFTRGFDAAAYVYAQAKPPAPTFRPGDLVRKRSGSAWQGTVCGTYSTTLTPEGYAVESSAHPGSVQIYPVGALEAVK